MLLFSQIKYMTCLCSLLLRISIHNQYNTGICPHLLAVDIIFIAFLFGTRFQFICLPPDIKLNNPETSSILVLDKSGQPPPLLFNCPELCNWHQWIDICMDALSTSHTSSRF